MWVALDTKQLNLRRRTRLGQPTVRIHENPMDENLEFGIFECRLNALRRGPRLATGRFHVLTRARAESVVEFVDLSALATP
eukprot:2909826-Pyramimonas_sp.AAC.1